MDRREFVTGAIGVLAAATNSSLTRTGQQSALTSSAARGCEDPRHINYDRHGLIVQYNGDGGDTSQREGWYWFGLWVREAYSMPAFPGRSLTFEGAMAHLEDGKSGIFRRHPTDPNWTDPNKFSRDQTLPIIAAMGVRKDGDPQRLQRLYEQLVRRNWMAQNRTDTLADPAHKNFVRRARNEAPDIWDTLGLCFAAQTRISVATVAGKDDVGDDLNLLLILLLATVRRPNNTPCVPIPGTLSARGHYAKNRPDNYGMYLGSYRQKYGVDCTGAVGKDEMIRRIEAGIKSGWKPDAPRVLGALRWYFRAETGGSPGLAEVYEPIVRRWFQ
jgi:hypothetical protein